MKCKTYLFFLLFLVVCQTCSSLIASEHLFLLRQLMEEQEPELQSLQLERQKLELERKMAFSSFLPTLRFESNQGLKENFHPKDSRRSKAGQSIWHSDLQITLKENLYQNGENLHQYRLAQKNLELEEIKFHSKRENLLKELLLTYYQWLEVHYLVRIRSDSTALLERQYKQMASLYRQGLKSRSDYLRFKGQMQSTKLQQYQEDRKQKEITLSLLKQLGQNKIPNKLKQYIEQLDLNQNFPVQDQVKEDLQLAHISPKEKILELEREKQLLSYEFNNRQRWPEINLSAGLTYQAFEYLSTTRPFLQRDGLTGQVLLTLSWDIWDFGKKRMRAEISALNQRQTTLELMKTKKDKVHALKSNQLLCDESIKNHRIFQKLRDIEHESYKSLLSQYRLG